MGHRIVAASILWAVSTWLMAGEVPREPTVEKDASATATERTERFDRDPKWDGRNNRAASPEPRTVRHDFGFSRTNHAGAQAGEIGGLISPAAEPAYYAKRIPTRSFDDAMEASGKLMASGEPFHVLITFFNSKTINEWRTPNTIAIRLSGRGDVFYAWVEYATSRWRAGGDNPKGFPTERNPQTRRSEQTGFPAGKVYDWSLRYDPMANNGRGVVTAQIGGETAICHLDEGHKADGATFDRFGIMTVMKSADAPGRLWLDDITVNGETEHFDADPGWDALQNRHSYESTNVRPRFDFGFSETQHAEGERRGELGGLVFRGDCRYPNTLAYYADRLNELSMARPLRASGRITLRRGVTDSTVLFGFFHSEHSVHVNPSQDSGLPKSFLGVSVEGPSREGFLFAPAYRVNGDVHGHGVYNQPPHIYPDGQSRFWRLEYSPGSGDDDGRLRVELDGKPVTISVPRACRDSGTQFNRFGIVTTWIDGNGQEIFLDDLTYTASHGREGE